MTEGNIKGFEEEIDKAVSKDFRVEQIDEMDKDNPSYRLMKDSLRFSNAEILYERKVISDLTPVIPRVQYLFGIKPIEGLCILTSNRIHKKVLCDGTLYKLCQSTPSPVHSLMYLLVNSEEFRVWTYIPPDADGKRHPDLPENRFRILLFSA